jgi:hypothetical protein
MFPESSRVPAALLANGRGGAWSVCHQENVMIAEPGSTVADAQAEIGTIARQITTEHPERNSFEGYVKPLTDHVSGRIRLAVWVLAGAVRMVMLIVCANLSNLLLARSASRQKELAIRAEYVAVCLPAFSPDTLHRDDPAR